MVYGFYFRFYKKFHNELFCSILAKIAYFLYCVFFGVKKIKRKKTKKIMNVSKAKKIVNGVYPRLDSKPVYDNKAIDSSVDLSIVVPVYNYVEIIKANIDAILNQKTRYNYELIIVDDGSTKDNTYEIAKRYEKEYPDIVKAVHQENGGHGEAVNTGLKHATGRVL